MSPERIVSRESPRAERRHQAEIVGSIELKTGSGSAEYLLAAIDKLNTILWRPVNKQELVAVIKEVVVNNFWSNINPINPLLHEDMNQELIEPAVQRIIEGFLDTSIDPITKRPKNLLTSPDNFELTDYGVEVLDQVIVLSEKVINDASKS